MKKIFIGSMTYEGKNYCFDRWKENLDRILDYTHQNINIITKVVLVDNSPTEDYYNYLKENFDGEVIHEKFMEQTNANLAYSRNRLRKEFLAIDYDYFWCLESDVFPPIDCLFELLNHDVDVVSGIYMIGQGMRWKRHCAVMPFIPVEEARKLPENNVEIQLSKERLVKVLQGSMGVCLIKRHVLEKINFFSLRAKNNYIIHDDTFFFNECEILGIQVYVDSLMMCQHFQSNWWKDFVLKREVEKYGDSENQNIIIKEVN